MHSVDFARILGTFFIDLKKKKKFSHVLFSVCCVTQSIFCTICEASH